MGSLLNIDWVSVAKGAAVAVLGAAATYVTQYVSGHDFGTYAVIVGAVASTLVNVLRKWAVELGGGTTPTAKTKK